MTDFPLILIDDLKVVYLPGHSDLTAPLGRNFWDIQIKPQYNRGPDHWEE